MSHHVRYDPCRSYSLLVADKAVPFGCCGCGLWADLFQCRAALEDQPGWEIAAGSPVLAVAEPTHHRGRIRWTWAPRRHSGAGPHDDCLLAAGWVELYRHQWPGRLTDRSGPLHGKVTLATAHPLVAGDLVDVVWDYAWAVMTVGVRRMAVKSVGVSTITVDGRQVSQYELAIDGGVPFPPTGPGYLPDVGQWVRLLPRSEKTGVLSTRVDDQHGTVTLYSDHGLTTDDLVDLDGAANCYDCTVDSVAGDLVTITVPAGPPVYPLPAQGTAVELTAHDCPAYWPWHGSPTYWDRCLNPAPPPADGTVIGEVAVRDGRAWQVLEVPEGSVAVADPGITSPYVPLRFVVTVRPSKLSEGDVIWLLLDYGDGANCLGVEWEIGKYILAAGDNHPGLCRIFAWTGGSYRQYGVIGNAYYAVEQDAELHADPPADRLDLIATLWPAEHPSHAGQQVLAGSTSPAGRWCNAAGYVPAITRPRIAVMNESGAVLQVRQATLEADADGQCVDANPLCRYAIDGMPPRELQLVVSGWVPEQWPDPCCYNLDGTFVLDWDEDNPCQFVSAEVATACGGTIEYRFQLDNCGGWATVEPVLTITYRHPGKADQTIICRAAEMAAPLDCLTGGDLDSITFDAATLPGGNPRIFFWDVGGHCQPGPSFLASLAVTAEWPDP